jgi:hypothetical protein
MSRASEPLLGLGLRLAGPRAGDPRESEARSVVDQSADQRKQGSLDRQGGQELAPRDVAVLRLGGLLIVDQAPERREQLTADQASHQTAADAYRRKQKLGHDYRRPNSQPMAIPTTSVPPSANGTGFSETVAESCCAPALADSGLASLALATKSSVLA